MNLLSKLTTAKWYSQIIYFVKFSIVGIVNTAVDFSAFALLYSVLGIHYLPSQAISYTLGLLNSFVLNKLWTFNNRSCQIPVQLTKFFSINIVSLLISLLGLRLLCGYFGFNVYIVKICIIIITQMVNYCGYRFWVFQKNLNRF